MKKIKSTMLSCTILLALLVSSFCVSTPSSYAQDIPEPTAPHTMTAAYGGATITDLFNTGERTGTMTLKYFDWVPSDQISLISGGNPAERTFLTYSFDGLTTETTPYYFVIGVDEKTMFGLGPFKYDSSTKKYTEITEWSMSQILETTPTLSSNQINYLMSFWNGSGRSFEKINNLSASTIDPTSASINCPEYKLKIDYTAETSSYAFTDPLEKERVVAGKPPKGTKIRMYYMPPGSPGVYFGEPVDHFDMNDETDTFNISYDGIKPGKYILVSEVGVEKIEKVPAEYMFEPNLNRGERFDSFLSRHSNKQGSAALIAGTAGAASGAIAGSIIPGVGTIVGAIAGGLVAGVVSFFKGSANAYIEAYSGWTFFNVDANGNIDPNLINGCPPVLELTRDESKDVQIGDKGVCDAGGKNDIMSMINEALCGLTVIIKGWADSAYHWTSGWMETMIGVTRNKEQDLTDPLGTGSTTTSTTATSTTTPSTSTSTTTPSTSTSTDNQSALTDLQGKAINLCNARKVIFNTTAWSEGPCLTENLENSGYAVDTTHVPTQAVDEKNTCKNSAKLIKLNVNNCKIIK